MTILLRNFDLLKSPLQPLLQSSSLLIEDGVIEAIDPDLDSLETVDQVVNGEGRLLLPGLVNSHTHLGMTLFRGFRDDLALGEWLEDWIWPAEELLTPEDVYWAALLGIVEGLHSGITCFADMYFYMDSVARALRDAGARGLISSGIIAPELQGQGEEELCTAFKLVERWDGEAEGKISVALSPHAPYTCGDEVWKEVVRYSRVEKVPIHTHLAETEREIEDSLGRHGKKPVARLRELGVLDCDVIAAHCIHLEEDEIDILREADIRPIYNPSSNMKLSSGIAPVARMAELGMTVGLGTDGPATNNDLDMFEEMRVGGFLQKLASDDPSVLDAPSLLSMASSKGAAALGFDSLGSIKEGSRADLIALDRDAPHLKPEYDVVSNLVYAGKSSDVDFVMVDGKPVLQDGQVTNVDESTVYREVAERADKFRKMRSKKTD
ncbi:MAG: amidohydrolase [Candidatus Acetothermia bacterium]